MPVLGSTPRLRPDGDDYLFTDTYGQTWRLRVTQEHDIPLVIELENRPGLPVPGMTDLMVSPESITTEPEMLELEDAPPIQTADAGEAFHGATTDDPVLYTDFYERAGYEDEFRRRRDQSAERYTREDGSPK